MGSPKYTGKIAYKNEDEEEVDEKKKKKELCWEEQQKNANDRYKKWINRWTKSYKLCK